MEKLSSRKLWALIIISLVMIGLNYMGTISSNDLTNWLIFGYGIYGGTNAVSKFAYNGTS